MRADSCYLKNRTIERRRISILMPTNPWDWKSASYTLYENGVSFVNNQVWGRSYNLRRNLKKRGAQRKKTGLVQRTPRSLFPWLRKPTQKKEETQLKESTFVKLCDPARRLSVDLNPTPGARFSKVPKLFGRISGGLVLFVSLKQRHLETRNVAVIFIIIPFTTYEKTSLTE